MNTRENFLAVENLKNIKGIGINFEERAIPISFIKLRERDKLKEYKLTPMEVTQANFKDIIIECMKNNILIKNVEIDCNEDLQLAINEAIKSQNFEELKEYYEEMKYNEIEIQSIEFEKNKKSFTVNRFGVINLEFDESIPTEDILNENTVFRMLGV